MNRRTLLRHRPGYYRWSAYFRNIFFHPFSANYIRSHKLDIIPYPVLLALAFTVLWLILAIKPWYRYDWFLENLLVFAAIPFLVYCFKHHFFSNLSYTFIFIFLVFHIIGAHYTFSEVPFAERLSALFGWQRNHYDRIVHFLFGALLTLPVFELLSHKTSAVLSMKLLLSFSLIFSMGAVYEIIEWLTAIIVSPEAGTAYLGTQGDQWDAQKDLAIKMVGSFIAIAVIFFLKRKKA